MENTKMYLTKIFSRLTNVGWLAQNCQKNWLRYFVCTTILKLRWRIRGGGILIVGAEAMYLSVLADVGCDPENTLEFYLQELCQWRALGDHWEQKTQETLTPSRRRLMNMDESKPYWGQVLARYVPHVIYYALIRELKPKIIVETGTSYGGGTMFLIAAIHKNGEGRVISIDIPPIDGKLTMSETVERKDIGSFIPEFLKGLWEYREGDAKVLLPRVLVEEDVDFFIHDSLHTPTHMAFEYAVARALMRHKTVIATDDILLNTAFDSFLATHQLTGYASIDYPNTGITVNLFSEEELAISTGIVTLD